MTKTENIPVYLREHGLFCLWKYEERDGRKTKVPYNPNNPQYRAKSNSPETFARMETAANRVTGFNGLGVGLFGDIAGIDIDHCVNNNKLSEMAADIVETMDSYTEISPSGEGIRIFFLAPNYNYDKDEYYVKESKKGLEIYIAGNTNRFLTITGNVIRNQIIADRTDRLPIVLDKYMKRQHKQPHKQPQNNNTISYKPIELSDQELIDKAMNSKKGSLFKSLWEGDYSMCVSTDKSGNRYCDHSDGDLQLCNMLAFWTGKDAARMDSLFRQSGLMRKKWDEKRGSNTYGEMTIQKAVDDCTEVYTPLPERHFPKPQPRKEAASDNSIQEGEELPQNDTKEELNLDQFHIFNKNGQITGVFDYEIHKYIKAVEDIIVLGGVPYIYHNGVFVPDKSGAELTTMIRKLIYPRFVKSTTLKRIYDLFIRDADILVDDTEVNDYPVEWINFKNGFYDPKSRKIIPHDPKYKALNQIPHEYYPDGQRHGTVVQEWLDFICEDPDDKEMLCQYAGYCLTRDITQQKFLILNGEGGTGKSTLISMINDMVGRKNISFLSIHQIVTNRFAPSALRGKLLNSCADLEIDALNDTSTLKKALGEDGI